jgi:hypothetical protein
VAPSSGIKCCFAMSLDALLCLIPPHTMHVGGGEPVYHRSTLFFPCSLSLLPKKHRLILFIVDISTLFLILLISNFYPWLFC